MNCERCKEPDADCLTRDRARVCQTCLYEQVERERDLLREEVVRLRGAGEVLVRSIAKMTAERDALLTQRGHLRRRLADLRPLIGWCPPDQDGINKVVAVREKVDATLAGIPE